MLPSDYHAAAHSRVGRRGGSKAGADEGMGNDCAHDKGRAQQTRGQLRGGEHDASLVSCSGASTVRACVHARVKHSWVPRFPSPTSSLLLLKRVATLQVALCIFTCAHGEECRCLLPRGRYLKSIDASGQDQSLSQAPQRAAFSRANVDTGGGSHSAWLQPRAARQAPRVCHKAGFDAGGAVRRSEGGRAGT